ncbi:VasL domain-containing protein [Escherichia coli]|uniref:VasL domain-containing protein n=1 Tax=Escherichia coli TaxID=562 RepID=UPI003AFA7729
MGIQNFDHSHHKLKIRGLQSPVDVLTFEGREQLSTPFRYDIQFTSTDKAITPELVLMQDGAFSLTAPPADSLAKSAQELFNGKEKTPQQSREGDVPVGPLDKTFAPLLRLLGDKAGGGDSQLSLQTYLRTIAASQMQLEQLNKLPARWPLEQGYRQLRQLDALWPDNPQVRALNAQWRKQRELSALSTEALNGYAQAQSQLQRLSAQLDALDERKGRYLTGSELKTAVYGIRQSLKEPPLEELLRQLEEQKQTGEVSPTLLTQIDTRLNQLLNRYVILLDTKVEQSQ